MVTFSATAPDSCRCSENDNRAPSMFTSKSRFCGRPDSKLQPAQFYTQGLPTKSPAGLALSLILFKIGNRNSAFGQDFL